MSFSSSGLMHKKSTRTFILQPCIHQLKDSFLRETFLIISLLPSFSTFFKALITRQSYLRYFLAFLLSPSENYQLCKGKTALARSVWHLENTMERGAWRATVHVVTESSTTEQLSMHTHFWRSHFRAWGGKRAGACATPAQLVGRGQARPEEAVLALAPSPVSWGGGEFADAASCFLPTCRMRGSV